MFISQNKLISHPIFLQGKESKIYLDNDSENQKIVFTNKIKRSKNSEDASSLIGWMEIQSVTIRQYCLTKL